MSVPLFDLGRLVAPHRSALSEKFTRSMQNCEFINGKEVLLLEKDLQKYTNIDNFIGVSSGTDALLAIFMGLNLDRGSEVLVSPFTFVASATSILRSGLKPVFVDVAKDSFHPGIEQYEKSITKKTRAILAIHIFGQPNNMKILKKFCEEKNLFLIEDCAQAMGSTWGSSHVGSFGHASAFSFFPAKNLGCFGDGGAIATNSEQFAQHLRVIKSHGAKEKYNTNILGGNFRLDTLQASILRELLGSLDSWIEKRRNNAAYYTSNLNSFDNLVLPEHIEGHSWNQYTLRTNRRDSLKKFLDTNNIGNAVYYPIPLHKQPLFGGSDGNFLNVEKLCQEVLSIPIYPGLTKDEREIVVEKINYFMEK